MTYYALVETPYNVVREVDKLVHLLKLEAALKAKLELTIRRELFIEWERL